MRLWRRAALAVVPIALLSAIAWFAPVVPGRLAGDEIEPKPLRRFTVSLKPGAAMDSPYQRGIRVSDGAEALVVQSADGGFYRRRLEVLEPEWIEGTELGDAGFLSPGAEWLGFKDIGGNLKRVPLSGGRAETLCAAGVNGDAAWGPDGFIYFMDLLEPRGLALFRVREEGGDPQRIYPKDGPGIAGVAGYTSIVLSTEGSPKIRGILMSVHTGPGAANARVEALSLDSGRVTRLLDGATLPLYSPSGHLVYSSAEGLWAVAFDADAMELVGSPVELTEAGMRPSGRQEFRSWDLSAEGTLVYTPSGTRRRIVASSWNGEARELDFETPDEREALALSPDGGSLALSRAGSIWVHDVNRGTEVLLTADDAHYPLWSPDGRHLVFVSNRGVGQELRWIELGGTGASEFLFGSANNLMPTSFVDEGNELLFSEWGDQASSVWRVSLGSDEAPRPVLDSAFGERVAAVSPDGSLMAYTSTETGDAEIYVRRYPQLDRKVRVSSRGGFYPRWAPDGERLVFLAPDGIYSAKVASDSSLVSEPALLVESRSTADSMELAVLSDNTGFLYVEVQRPSEVVVVQNYSSHLRSVAPRWER